jgi:hypothetical protein
LMPQSDSILDDYYWTISILYHIYIYLYCFFEEIFF